MTSDFANDCASNVDQPHDSRHNAICYDGAVTWCEDPRSLRKLQAKTAVDDSQSDCNPAKPYVSIAPYNPSAMLLEHDMVQEAQNRLEEKQNEQDNADDRMGLARDTDMRRHVDTNTERSNVKQVCECLYRSMNEPESSKVPKANQDCADWEEEDKCRCCKHSMGYHDPLSARQQVVEVGECAIPVRIIAVVVWVIISIGTSIPIASIATVVLCQGGRCCCSSVYRLFKRQSILTQDEKH